MEFESLLAQATGKGMVMVKSDETDALLEECDEVVKEADALCEVLDPESKPFESKYKARDLLDKILRRLEATKAVMMLESNKSIVSRLARQIAAVQVKVGAISWDCEEPHNAQKELEMACEFYFPGLVSKLAEIEEAEEAPKTATVAPVLPDLPNISPDLLGDALKCLNLLGILWAGRGQSGRSLGYLHGASQCYGHYTSTCPATANPDIENTCTHTLFYLAQAYGHLRETEKSSEYCKQTLQRQLSAGLGDIKTAIDWVRYSKHPKISFSDKILTFV
jgi:hypothetical protein